MQESPEGLSLAPAWPALPLCRVCLTFCTMQRQLAQSKLLQCPAAAAPGMYSLFWTCRHVTFTLCRSVFACLCSSARVFKAVVSFSSLQDAAAKFLQSCVDEKRCLFLLDSSCGVMSAMSLPKPRSLQDAAVRTSTCIWDFDA